MSSDRHYFKELRLQQFRSLLALAHHHTFSAAAVFLGLTRTTVWQQIRSLEAELGCTLLHTNRQRVKLTATGHKLVEIVAPLVAGFDSVKSALQASVQDETGQTLSIAAAPNFLIQELREPVARIHEEYPSLLITFLERNSPAAVELLDQGEADVAIVARPESIPPKSSLDYFWFSTYPFTLICPPDHPLATGKKTTLQNLIHYPLILPAPHTYCRQQFDAVLRKAGLTNAATIVLESGFPVMLFEYVRMGFGVGLSPLPPVSSGKRSPEGVVLRSVAHIFGDEPIYYVRRKGEFETPQAARFRALVTGSGKD